jgi:predicted anti-sigma-YlaC factor YlaD
MSTVECEECREALSARLDGEEDVAERAGVDRHLAGCGACRQWFDDAAAVTRLTRTGLVTVSPGVSETVLTAAPGPGRARAAGLLRGLLGVLGAVQFVLGMVEISAFAATSHAHAAVVTAGASSSHLWHESAAWNVAVGAGFVWIAARRSRPVGIVPTLTAFVVVLSALSGGDILAGRVDATRLLSHGFLIAGYAIVLLLTRPAFDFGEPPTGRLAGRSGWRARFDDDEQARVASPRALPGFSAGQRSARHRPAA